MKPVFVACIRALRSLLRPDIFWHLLWPTVLAIVVWAGIGMAFWAEALATVVSWVQAFPVVGGWLSPTHETAQAVFAFAVNLVLLLLMLPFIYATAALIVSAFAMPLMLDRIAVTDYADLALRRGGSFWGSVWNSLLALLIFVVLAALSLPLWFVPGLGIGFSLALSVWLNKRCYSYDALMNHADRDELQRLPREHRRHLYGLGAGIGIVGFVPVVNLFVPAFVGLAFVHYLLEALRSERARPLRDIDGTVL